MAEVKLGRKEFDVNSVEINASGCGASAADLALFADRMKTGEISRLKELNLVMFFRRLCFCCIFFVCRARARVCVCLSVCLSVCLRQGLTSAVQARNQIGDDGAKSIAAAVEGNSSVQILYLVR